MIRSLMPPIKGFSAQVPADTSLHIGQQFLWHLPWNTSCRTCPAEISSLASKKGKLQHRSTARFPFNYWFFCRPPTFSSFGQALLLLTFLVFLLPANLPSQSTEYISDLRCQYTGGMTPSIRLYYKGSSRFCQSYFRQNSEHHQPAVTVHGVGGHKK